MSSTALALRAAIWAVLIAAIWAEVRPPTWVPDRAATSSAPSPSKAAVVSCPRSLASKAWICVLLMAASWEEVRPLACAVVMATI